MLGSVDIFKTFSAWWTEGTETTTLLVPRLSVWMNNNQVSEQTNLSLRKLSIVLAYYGWENYLLFLVAKNLRIKNILS
jgi:hypothetical protein